MVCATVANYAGKVLADNSEPVGPADFMPSLAALRPAADNTPLLMETPEAQAELIKKTLFKG